MNEELTSFVISLLEDTQFKMDEYQTPSCYRTLQDNEI